MRKMFVAAALLFVVSVGQGGLLACGDKFFLVGRGDRFTRAYASLHPGTIVIYAGGGSATSKALSDGRLQKYFTRAGHRVTVARDHAALARALESSQVDVVMAGIVEALDMKAGIDAASSKPTLLPVQDDADKAADMAQHQFAATLKTSDKINGFLAKIEGVMKARTSPATRGRS
jgi:hypothetical protein